MGILPNIPAVVVFSLLVIILQVWNGIDAEPRAVTAEERIMTEILTNYSIFSRPVNDSADAVVVSISFTFAAMLNLVEKDQVLTSSSWIQLRWMDHRLTWDPEDYEGVGLIPIEPSQVWLPKLVVFNSIGSDGSGVVDREKGQILVLNTGEVNLGFQLRISTLCPLWVTYFPYDKQVCPFYFGFQNQMSSLGRLESLGAFISPYPTTTQWSTTGVTSNASTELLPGLTSREEASFASVLTFCLHIERDPRYHVYSLIIPSSCMCFVAFLSFLAPPDSGERLGISISMVLGLTVFNLLMSETLPISGDPPILSEYFMINFVTVVLTIAISLMSIGIVYGNRGGGLVAIVRWRWFRVLFLEVLPRIFCVPSLAKQLGKSRGVSMGGGTTTKVTPIRGEDSELGIPEKPDLGGTIGELMAERELTNEEKAFDEGAYKRLLLKLESSGIDGNLLMWIEGWLHDKEQRVEKLVGRTVALVIDRFLFITLTTVLLGRTVALFWSLSQPVEVMHV